MNLFFQELGRIAGKGIPVLILVEFFALSLAWILALAVPMAVLISTLSAFGRMSGDGEITALRASGISPMQMIKPALIWGIFMTLFVGWFNNYVLPDMNHRTKLLGIDIHRKKPTMNIEPDIYNFDIPNYVLHVSDIDRENGTLKDITIYDEHNPDERSTIAAKDGKLEFVAAADAVILTLTDGEIHRPSRREPNGYEHTRFDSSLFRLRVPGMTLQRVDRAYRGDRELTVMDLMKRIRDLKEKSSSHNRRRISAYTVEIHKKFSIPVACFVFIILGAPLGILSHKGGMGVAGAISLIFFTFYWALLTNGEDLADRGIVSPALSMWIANIILAIAGLYFLWLARRRTTLPGMQFISNLLTRLFAPHKRMKDER